MQHLEDYRLRGLISPISPAVRRRTRPMSVAEAQRIAGVTPTPTPAARPVVARRKPATATRTAAVSDGIQWISESRALADDLPDGNYIWKDKRGRVHRRDVGEMACRQSLRDRRLHRGDITGGLSDREIRDGWAVRAAGRFQVVVN